MIKKYIEKSIKKINPFYLKKYRINTKGKQVIYSSNVNIHKHILDFEVLKDKWVKLNNNYIRCENILYNGDVPIIIWKYVVADPGCITIAYNGKLIVYYKENIHVVDESDVNEIIDNYLKTWNKV